MKLATNSLTNERFRKFAHILQGVIAICECTFDCKLFLFINVIFFKSWNIPLYSVFNVLKMMILEATEISDDSQKCVTQILKIFAILIL